MTHILRRKNLLAQMEELSQGDITCRRCSGLCCTSLSNSMKVTAIEAWDLYSYVEANFSPEIFSKCEMTIKKYRLDYEIATKRGSQLRKTYTCPFFKEESLGCPIPPEFKPYGCLAFNPTQAESIEGEGCKSDQEALIEREKNVANEQVESDALSLFEGKLTIPEAMIHLRKSVGPLSK